MRVALDTNILIYAEGVNDAARQEQAQDVIARLARMEAILPVQVAGELFRVLVGKAHRRPADARAAVLQWQALFEVAPTTADAFAAALDLAADHNLPLWDAVILAVAADARCDVLLSEDYSDGFSWRGVTVVNPFGAATAPRLLGSAPSR